MEKAWNEYFSDPTQWWDNRGKKVSPRVIVSDEIDVKVDMIVLMVAHWLFTQVSVIFDKVP